MLRDREFELLTPTEPCRRLIQPARLGFFISWKWLLRRPAVFRKGIGRGSGCAQPMRFRRVSLLEMPDKTSRSLERMLSRDRKSTRLNSSHGYISYAVF